MFGSHHNEKFLDKFARIGLSAKGIVYCLLGIMAFLTAIGIRSQKGNKEEAFKMIHEQPFGQVMLMIIGVSLLGFVMLRFFQAVLDTEDKGTGSKAIFKRLGLGISGLIYLGISFFAMKMAVTGASGGDSKKIYIGKILEFPGGKIIVGIIAAIVIGQGIFQIYKGVTGKFMKKVQLYTSDFKKSFKRIGVVGNCSRGIVLCIIGYFLFRAALDSNANEAGDTDSAFGFLRDKGGNILMGTVALGLTAYGVFMFVRARHEKVKLN